MNEQNNTTQTISNTYNNIVFDETIYSGENNAEKSKILHAGNLCFNRNNKVNELLRLQYSYSYYNNFSVQTIKQHLKPSILWILFCIFYWAIFIPAVLIGIICLYNNFNTDPSLTNILFFCCSLISIMSIFVFGMIIVAKNNSEHKKAQNMLNNIKSQQLPPLSTAINNLKQEISVLENHMIDRNNCIIPQLYWDYGDIIASYIYNSRANTLAEAINIFELEKHNQQVRLNQQRANAQMQLSNQLAQRNYEMLRRINRNVKWSYPIIIFK